MEGISGLHNYGASCRFEATHDDPCAERTNHAAISCLEEKASFSGRELPLQPLLGVPNLWKKLL